MNKKDVCATQIAYVRFTEDDLADLDNQVRRVGASSRGAYIRSLIKGVRPVELPPAAVLIQWQLARQTTRRLRSAPSNTIHYPALRR